MIFEILNKSSKDILNEDSTYQIKFYKNIYDENHILKSKYCNNFLIKELFEEKHKIDYFYDNNYDKEYITARNTIFPTDKKGSSKFSNRAGDKILEVLQLINIDKDLQKKHYEPFYFSSVADGPGSWVEVILKLVKYPVKGFGMTLLIPGKSSLNWYPWILKNRNFIIENGKTGTGDIYVSDNLIKFNNTIKSHTNNKMINLALSDGGIEVGGVINGIHYDNIQELLNNRLKLSEFYIALQNLQEDGMMLSKIYDTLGNVMVSILYIASLVFDKVLIVKPKTSRLVNSEKYLYCSGYKRNDKILKIIFDIIRLSNEKNIPETIINPELIEKDEIFMNSLKNFNETYITKQLDALKKVNEETMKLINN